MQGVRRKDGVAVVPGAFWSPVEMVEGKLEVAE